MQVFAPIALFVYNRPSHTERTLTFLKKNHLASETRLFIFADGPKTDRDSENVQKVRELIQQVEGFRSVQIILREQNMGLAQNIISGVTKLMNEYGQAIVLEDDLVSSPFMLQYFNDALNTYREEDRVMHIGAYMYPLEDQTLPQTFFYRAATSWGWATWARAWKHFEPDIALLMSRFDSQKKYAFSIEGTMNFWKQMREFESGRNNSWAIRWYASIFLRNGLTLNPSSSLVNNIGHDGSGVHSGLNDIYNVIINPQPISRFPTEIVEHAQAYAAIRGFLKNRKGSFWDRVKRYLKAKLKA